MLIFEVLFIVWIDGQVCGTHGGDVHFLENISFFPFIYYYFKQCELLFSLSFIIFHLYCFDDRVLKKKKKLIL